MTKLLAVSVLAIIVPIGGRLTTSAPREAQPPGTFTFAAAGDFTNGGNFHTTAAAVQAHAPAFLIALGDLSYDPDTEQAWCKYWADLSFKNLLLIAGNHDTGEHEGGDINQYIKHCGNPFSDKTVGKYAREYYFDYPFEDPLARFILITPGIEGDKGGIDTNYAAGSTGFKFTESAIDAARIKGIKWIFVGMHKNYISTMKKSNEISKDAKATFFTMLLNKKVDVILQGHEHGYERSKQLTTNPSTCPMIPDDDFQPACVVDADDMLVKGAGTVVHVIGTGGKDMRVLNTGRPAYKYFVPRFAYEDVQTFGFGSFTVTPTRLTYTYVRSTGPNFTDSFTIAETTAPHP